MSGVGALAIHPDRAAASSPGALGGAVVATAQKLTFRFMPLTGKVFAPTIKKSRPEALECMRPSAFVTPAAPLSCCSMAPGMGVQPPAVAAARPPAAAPSVFRQKP